MPVITTGMRILVISGSFRVLRLSKRKKFKKHKVYGKILKIRGQKLRNL
jgi:hypothetical protein